MAKAEKLVEMAQEQHLQGEEVKFWVFGAFKSKIMGKDTLRNGVFIATDRQVFFFCKKMIGFETESFPLSNISSVEIGKSLTDHKINIVASGNKAEMSMINRGQVNEFVDFVRSKIGKTSSAAHSATPDATDELRKYKALYDDGIITEDEFNEKKKQLLGL